MTAPRLRAVATAPGPAPGRRRLAADAGQRQLRIANDVVVDKIFAAAAKPVLQQERTLHGYVPRTVPLSVELFNVT